MTRGDYILQSQWRFQKATDPYLPEEPDKYNDNDIGNKFDIDGNIQYWYNLALNDRTKIKQGQIDQAEFSFRVLEKTH